MTCLWEWAGWVFMYIVAYSALLSNPENQQNITWLLHIYYYTGKFTIAKDDWFFAKGKLINISKKRAKPKTLFSFSCQNVKIIPNLKITAFLLVDIIQICDLLIRWFHEYFKLFHVLLYDNFVRYFGTISRKCIYFFLSARSQKKVQVEFF